LKINHWSFRVLGKVPPRKGTSAERLLTKYSERRYRLLPIFGGAISVKAIGSIDRRNRALAAYEGTSVQTQTRVSGTKQVQNTTLSASLYPLLAGTNLTVNTPLQLGVTANTSATSRIELFSTGGSLGVISNLQSAVFSLSVRFLGVGLHPFYALVTDTLGNRYRTETLQLRIIPSFKVEIMASPLTLTWPSVPGLSYNILACTNLSTGFQRVATVTAADTTVQWPIPSPSANESYYRVELSH
jgi:hypothetical protein